MIRDIIWLRLFFPNNFGEISTICIEAPTFTLELCISTLKCLSWLRECDAVTRTCFLAILWHHSVNSKHPTFTRSEERRAVMKTSASTMQFFFACFSIYPLKKYTFPSQDKTIHKYITMDLKKTLDTWLS